jgi:hypothetical protein
MLKTKKAKAKEMRVKRKRAIVVEKRGLNFKKGRWSEKWKARKRHQVKNEGRTECRNFQGF